jgi:hypothetical protein
MSSEFNFLIPVGQVALSAVSTYSENNLLENYT